MRRLLRIAQGYLAFTMLCCLAVCFIAVAKNPRYRDPGPPAPLKIYMSVPWSEPCSLACARLCGMEVR